MNTTTQKLAHTKWEEHFQEFRDNIVGQNAEFVGPYGPKRIIYADWIASGRLYGPIEDKMKSEFGPLEPIHIPKLRIQVP
jgi:hypothetical protein